MFLPFDIGEIHGAIGLAYRVINIGWSDVHNAHQQYIEFKQDIEALKEQLESLQLTIKISRARTGAQLAPSGQLNQIFANFRETLEDCRQLLESQARFGAQQGPVSNFEWFLLVKDEVNMHRDRIAVLNSKLSLALQSLEIETRDGQTVLMLECTSLVLARIDLLGAQIARVLGEPLPIESPQRLDVPQPLEELLASIATARYGSLTSIPMAQGADKAIFYLDRATQWHARRQSTHRCQPFKWANLFRAYWLLQATMASDEYQAASTTISVAQLERDFPRLGMTARRFFSNLQEKIVGAHAQLARSGERVPPVNRLLEIIEQDSNAWQEHDEWRPQQEDDDDPRRGEKVAACRLRNTSTTTGQSLEVYRHAEGQEHLTVITSGAGRADRVHQVDLKCVHLAPSLEAVSPNTSFYSITLSPVRSHNQSGFRLTFQGEEDLFEFQEWMTGYKVVDDYPNTVVTSQRANAIIGGERRRDTGRVQLWSSTRPSPGSQLPEEFLDSEPSTQPRRTTEPRTVSPYPPILGPLASFSRLSLSLQTTRSSSAGSVLPDAQAVPRSRSGTPSSLTRTSTVTSSTTSRSSTPSVSGLTKRPRNLIQVDKRGNMGCILDQPDPPRLVIFLPAIDQNIRINPAICDCQQDDRATSLIRRQGQQHRNGAPSLDALNEEAQQQQQQQAQLECKKVVLQVVDKSGITASETEGTESWNLAGAGRYQSGEGLGRVKRLKKVALVFRGVEGTSSFSFYFLFL
ncbi:hypothetical protein C8A01DRAFT_50286 [Parachaetomium inaequale]|uniref:Uncharacterized protein n=1 Tax=Parachaetomium inaequale TaxID=2588326 RepID=A0AAN6P7H4_9PEZI|nr:hypothetical protein C8A01DRAFT_50286 [Parachaetomium inaequale]